MIKLPMAKMARPKRARSKMARPTSLSDLDCFGLIEPLLVLRASLLRSFRVALAFQSPPVEIPWCEIGPRMSSTNGKLPSISSSQLVESLLQSAIPTID